MNSSALESRDHRLEITTLLITAKTSTWHSTSYTVENNISLQMITLRQLLNENSGQLRSPILILGKTVRLQAIGRLCNRLFMIMLNC